MRLRRLGTTQSIVFLAPPEVNQSIVDLRQKTSPKRIGIPNSFDVVVWLLENSCAGVEQLQPLFTSQGMDFCRRQIAARDNSNAAQDADQRASYLKILEQREQYTLEQLYAPKRATKTSAIDTSNHIDIAGFVKTLITTSRRT